MLADAGENVEYAYAFLTPEAGHAYVIVRVDDNAVATAVLQENGITVIDEDSIL